MIGTCRTHRALSASRKLYMENYKNNNLSKITDYKKQWSSKNRKKLSKNWKERYQNDVNFKLAAVIRNRLNKILKSKRSYSGTKFLGCDSAFLKSYLEKLFKEGMTWENHGLHGWHVDHIIPLCNFDLTNEEQAKKAFHYTNLQPLWSRENLMKKKRIKYSHECPTTHEVDEVC